MGRDLIEGDEDEGARGEAWVRDFEAGDAEDKVVVEEDVEIERARAVGVGGAAVAAEFKFDGEEGAEQSERAKSGFERQYGVEEAGLGDIGDGHADGRG